MHNYTDVLYKLYVYYCADMARKPLTKVVEQIREILQKEGELSIRQISIKVKSEWRTVAKALELMKSLGTVKERKGTETKREERLFRLK